MQKFFWSLCLSIFTVICFAANNCPKTTKTDVNEVVFVYKKISKNEVYYIPFARLKDNMIQGANDIQLPTNTTLYFMKNDKPIDLEFKNEPNVVDENVCHSIAVADLSEGNKNDFEIFATKPLAKDFNFKPSPEELSQFTTNIQTPCSKAKPNYNEDGIMTCDASQLIAVSNFGGKKQFWHSKQYRYALGFGIESEESSGQFKEVAEDCSRCAD